MKIDVLLWCNLRPGREMKFEKRSMTRETFSRSLGFAMSFMERQRTIRHDATGVDISGDGLGLVTNVSLTQGNVLRLLIPINGVSLPVFAVVKWSEPCKDKFRAGLQFLG